MRADTPHSMADAAGRRVPAPDGIPFLRAGREALAAEALARLDAGDREGALVLLLADQDEWWRGPVADPAALLELVRTQHRLTLREAMELLAWGPVGTYFAHRWSDPTFLAGLALVEAHWTLPRSAFELALRHRPPSRRAVAARRAVTGVDVVFAKLWLARHFVCPQARLLCLDAAQDWPGIGRFDLVACHDAFYFLEPKAAILARLRGLVEPGRGLLAIGHVHKPRMAELLRRLRGHVAEMAALMPDAVLYDDAELTRALAEARAPMPALPEALRGAEAFAAVAGPWALPRPGRSRAARAAAAGRALRRNPLYGARAASPGPSERYGREYGARATYPPGTPRRPARAGRRDGGGRARRELLDLPERW
jgi:hypothetical protein